MAILGCPGFPWGRELSATGWQMLFPCWGGLHMEMVYRGAEQASWFSPCVYPFISAGLLSFWGRTTAEYLAGATSHGNRSTMDTSLAGAGSSENWSTVDFSADCYAAGPRSLCKVGATADHQHLVGAASHGNWSTADTGLAGACPSRNRSIVDNGADRTQAGSHSHSREELPWSINMQLGPVPMGTGLPWTWIRLGMGPQGTGLLQTPGLTCFLAGSHSPFRGGATMKGQHLAGAGSNI